MKLNWDIEHDDAWVLEERHLYIAECGDRLYVVRSFNPVTNNYPEDKWPLDYNGDGPVWGLHVHTPENRFKPSLGPDRVFSDHDSALLAAQQIEDNQ